MKRLIIEFKEEELRITTEMQYMDGYEHFSKLETIGLLSNLITKLNLDLDKKPKKTTK